MTVTPQSSERLIQFTVDCFSEAAYWLDGSGKLFHGNRAACEALGYSREELLSKEVSDIDPTYDREKVKERLDEVRRRGIMTLESVHRRKDGTEFPVEITVSHLQLDDREVFVAVARDVTESRESQKAVRRSDLRYRRLFENVPIALYKSAANGRLLEANQALVELLGYPDLEHAGLANTTDSYVRPADRKDVLRELKDKGVVRGRELQLRRPDGAVIWARLNARAVTDPETHDLTYEGSLQEITEWKRAQEKLNQRERRFRSLVQNSMDLLSINRPDGTVIYASPAHTRVLGYDPEERRGQNSFDLIHPDDRERVSQAIQQLVQEPDWLATVEYRFRHCDGSWLTLESICTNRLDDPAIGGLVVNSRDVTKRRQAEEQLRHQALHDSLTELPNRALIIDRLESAIARRERHPTRMLAVLFLDLDRFKVINDSLGHTVGDQLLIEVANLLKENLKPTDSIARLGGDEFLIVLEEIGGASGALLVTERINKLLSKPFQIGGYEAVTTASIGVSFGKSGATTPEDFLREADTALHRAKAEGGSCYVVFDDAMHHTALDRLQLEGELRQALEQRELTVLYQPIFRFDDSRVVGLEALARWQHPSRGLLEPDQFLHLAEETGMIRQLDQLVLDQACRELSQLCRRLADSGVPILSVNLSQKTLSIPKIGQRIKKLLAGYDLDPKLLTLEILESALFEDAKPATRALADIRGLGVRLSLDDFGTGFSSLSYLHRFPVDVLKIDRSFVGSIHQDRQVPEIVLAIITLGRNLGLEVVAEGIENAQQVEALRGLGCTHGQGFHLAVPLPFVQLEPLLTGGRFPTNLPTDSVLPGAESTG